MTNAWQTNYGARAQEEIDKENDKRDADLAKARAKWLEAVTQRKALLDAGAWHLAQQVEIPTRPNPKHFRHVPDLKEEPEEPDPDPLPIPIPRVR